MPESRPMETIRLPEPPENAVRETGSGRELAVSELASALRAGDLSIFHAAEALAIAVRETTPLATGKTPCAMLIGVLPRKSKGWVGTIPTVPPAERTQVAVE